MPGAHFSLITAIKELMNRQWIITIKHIYWEANFTADSMAKLAGSLPLGLHVFENPLRGLVISYVMIYMGSWFLVLFMPSFY